ncbi:MAG: toll/interleukin-1 receptor domain-containing protein [Acidobacteria bacterium]|nr:toll/interleukin-1 receptor domain-containing protein [Acidobacteriota bacterium]
MGTRDERERGVELLREILESGHVARVKGPQILSGGFSYHFEVTAYDKVVDFAISAEALEDLVGTPEYRSLANGFARALDKRLRNPDPNSFLTRKGVPLAISSEWPQEPWPGRAASLVRTEARDIRSSRVAHCFVVITHQQQRFELIQDPFLKYEGIVNSIRDVVDADQIVFYPSGEHPTELQRVDLRLAKREPARPPLIESFLQQKVFWLGFKLGTSESRVWIADPWDANWLGVSTSDLIREAEILQAQGYLRLDDTKEFAGCGRELLLKARALELGTQGEQRPTETEAGKPDREWDVFIAHASEQKPFARELYAELTNRGIRVWLDEVVLKIGDSLRKVIDDGLSGSKFGVVVLSREFFAKHWPQKELGGLIAQEVDRKVILPVWYELTAEEVRKLSPLLADRFAAHSSEGVKSIADKIIDAMSL